MIPLYGFLEGDTLGLLLLAGEDETIAELAGKLQQSARVRVRPREHVELLHRGRAVNPALTVTQAGLQPLDRVDVVGKP